MLIQLEKIHKSYQNDSGELSREVLKDVNLNLNNGDLLSIVGPSGSGKSTLLNIMGRMDEASSGKVIYKGKDITSLTRNEMASFRSENLGFVFQQHHLLPQLSLRENVLLPFLGLKDKAQLKFANERADDLLDWVGLADRSVRRPGELSVGECQRGAVVRALIRKPELLLADEPTGSLDEANALQIIELFLEINQQENTAIVMVTHAAELAEKMKTNYKLTDGQLVLID